MMNYVQDKDPQNLLSTILSKKRVRSQSLAQFVFLLHQGFSDHKTRSSLTQTPHATMANDSKPD